MHVAACQRRRRAARCPLRFERCRPTTTGRPLKVGIQLPEVEREVRWPELLDMIRAIEDLGFDSVWVGEHLLYRWPDRPARGPWEAWTMLAAIAAVDHADRVRAARRLHQLPQPGAARQAGRHDRRDQRRPVRPRPRRRLERDRVPGLRLPVRPPGRPVRGGVHDHPDAPPRRRHRLRRALVPGPRLRAAAARPASGRPAADDRLERAADAARDDAARRLLEQLVQRHGQPARPASPRSATWSTRRAATSVATRPRSSGRWPSSSGCRAARAGSRAVYARASAPSRSSGEPGRDGRRSCAASPPRASATSSSCSTRSRVESIEALAPVLDRPRPRCG